MPKYEETPDKILTIRTFGRERGFTIEAWKYYEILDELRTRGISRELAEPAAKWATMVRTKGQYRDIPGVVMTVE